MVAQGMVTGSRGWRGEELRRQRKRREAGGEKGRGKGALALTDVAFASLVALAGEDELIHAREGVEDVEVVRFPQQEELRVSARAASVSAPAWRADTAICVDAESFGAKRAAARRTHKTTRKGKRRAATCGAAACCASWAQERGGRR